MKYLNESEGVKDILVDPQDILGRYEQNKHTIETLTKENKLLEKSAFDAIVRTVIDKGLVYMKCNHRDISAHDMTLSWRHRPRFHGRCRNCNAEINIHRCSIEKETYYFTCDEARVINNVARQYGIEGSIHTATQIQD